jgi:GR25 family glycosyltransferase involved in LPS biosynthesis
MQRFILVIRNGSFFKISYKTLIIDFKSSRNVNKSLKKRYSGDHSGDGDSSERIITCEHMDRASLSYLNKYFDHIYVINLARRADRRDEMIQKLTRLNIRAEFFPAEDGNSEENFKEFSDYLNAPIDPENVHEMELRLKRKVIFSPGAWGILKSYRKIILEASDRDFNKILCLEDDALFAKNFEELFIQATNIIPENWKILYLGASQHAWEESVDYNNPAYKFDENTPVKYYLPLNTDGAFAVGISQSVFPHLLSETNKMNCPFDSGALRSAAKVFKGECFVMNPNLVIADVRDSDIRIGRKQKDFAKIVRWDLNLYDFIR